MNSLNHCRRQPPDNPSDEAPNEATGHVKQSSAVPFACIPIVIWAAIADAQDARRFRV